MQARTNRNPKKDLIIESPQQRKDAGLCEAEADSPVVVLVRAV